MYRDVFSQDRPAADAAVADAAAESPILRHISHDGSRVNLAVVTDVRVAEDLHERPDR